jgi:hypothetical protein
MELTIVEQITVRVAVLPVERQREALALIESLASKEQRTLPAARHQRLKGATAGQVPPLTREALTEARKEMWGEYAEGDR